MILLLIISKYPYEMFNNRDELGWNGLRWFKCFVGKKKTSFSLLGSLAGAYKLSWQKSNRRKDMWILFYINILTFTYTESFIEKNEDPKKWLDLEP